MIATMTDGIAHGTSASGAGQPLEPQLRVEQQGQGQRQDELEDRHPEGPDQPDPERVPEQVVLQQPRVVREPVEREADVEAGAGVGEAQPMPLSSG